MSSSIGKIFRVSTFGESHGEAIGAVIDGCPAGIELNASDIQAFLDRRRPGQSSFTTKRDEKDICRILSGVFDNKTTGTPITVIVENKSMRSEDYEDIENYYRPSHADYTYDMKYGFRDYRGGGRSSGRETIGRVIAGAIASKALGSLSVYVKAFTQSIGPIHARKFNLDECDSNPLYMPDNQTSILAQNYIRELMEKQDSAGGIIGCIATGVPAGIGEPVFDKLDARISQAIMSIGAIKGIEIGAGFALSQMLGSEANDEYSIDEIDGKKRIVKRSNSSGGILGGISDGSPIIINTVIKPTPSISLTQNTVTKDMQEVEINIHGRHDPVIVPRAVVVIESMVAISIFDLMLIGMSSKMENVIKLYT